MSSYSDIYSLASFASSPMQSEDNAMDKNIVS